MAVRSSDQAREAVRRLIKKDRVPYRTLLRDPYLPPGFTAVDPHDDGKPWLWTEPPRGEVGGYGHPATYCLAAADSPVWRPPHEVLSANGTGSAATDDKRDYLRRSVDLTMRGGTTSGVVYPLAVCEIATRFRVRNVGGASAGAIAAAATAAAELGRSSMLPPQMYEPLPTEKQRQGHVRPGFVGLSDTIAWLAQITPEEGVGVRDEYRLAQLFRPASQQRRIFAAIVAFMRQQLWAVPLTVLIAVGRWAKVAIGLLVVAGVMVTSWLGSRLPSWPAVSRPGGTQAWWGPASLAWAGLDLILYFSAIGALLVLVPVLLSVGASKSSSPKWLKAMATVSSQYKRGRLLSLGFWRGLAAVLVLAGTLAFGYVHRWHWVAGGLVGATLSAALTAVVALSVWRWVKTAGDRHFGMVAGAAPKSRRRLSELLAGAARPTVERSLVAWLSDCLNQLAGLHGEVLRFGHLWKGRDFTPVRPQPPKPSQLGDMQAWKADLDEWVQDSDEARTLSADPARRLVNLELITTDLSRQRPFRFPLPWLDVNDKDAEVLYFRMEDLAPEGDDDGAIFPADVIEAMRDPNPLPVQPPEPGAERLTLHRLPDPWNLPVIFAVRLSLALPVLFQAVRLYRLQHRTVIRDDLGRRVENAAKQVLEWPPPGKVRVETLWFSDGGITSNFPVHLFDTPLPGWPTFGLNLGSHPYGFPHQDVWLPQDWQATFAPATDLGRSATGFAGAILDTARSWRDTMQTGMPGYRGRVAWVRQRPDEGGTNLYMPRDIIASMALRGALAGARLSRRFGDQSQWDRYRWLRLRVALDNMHNLRRATRRSKPFYDDILTRREKFLDGIDGEYLYDPFSGDIDWYSPTDPQFWQEADTLLTSLAAPSPQASPDPGDILTVDCPRPQPDLRQIPTM